MSSQDCVGHPACGAAQLSWPAGGHALEALASRGLGWKGEFASLKPEVGRTKQGGGCCWGLASDNWNVQKVTFKDMGKSWRRA